MNTQLLENFLRVAEFGSINRAAKEIGVTQPALSRALVELERDIGRPLLIRRRRGVALTNAGQLLADRAPELLQHTAAIREELSDEPAAQVVIGMPTPLRDHVTVPLINEMRAAAPKTKLRIFEGFNIYIKDLLNQGVLDIAIVPENLVPLADFEQVPIACEPIILFRRLSLPRPDDQAGVEEATRYPMAMPGRPNAVRTILEDALKAARLPALDVVLEPENMEIAHTLVRSECVDQCVTVGSVFDNPQQAGMWISRLGGLELRWMLAINRHRSHMMGLRKTRSLIEKVVGRALSEQRWAGARQI